MSTNMNAKKKLILMELAGSIITIGLIILNVVLIAEYIFYAIIGEEGIAKVLFVLLVLFSILIIPLGSFVMAAGLEWPEVSTLIIFFYVSFSPILAFAVLFHIALNPEPFISLAVAALICHISVHLTVSFFAKRGKAYRQKLLDEIAAEEAALPQDS